MTRRRLVCTSVALMAANGACSPDLARHADALFYVDTDVAVPSMASRLRVDLYAEDGTWYESRDIGRSDPLDWPASFGVFSDDDTRDVRVLVRLRAYPDGAVRDYAGERYAPRLTFTEPIVYGSIADACANAPLLPLGGRITLRRGPSAITTTNAQGRCAANVGAGSAVARVVITESGTYRFDVATMSPYGSESTLFLRKDCTDGSTQLQCDAEDKVSPIVSGHFPRFDAQLDPGTYFLLSGGQISNQPADVTFEAERVDGVLQSTAEAPPAMTAPPPLPRLAHADGTPDLTPATEPSPEIAIDRLVLVRLHPGRRDAIKITLRGECSGTMAKIVDGGNVDLATASTCIDTEDTRVPLDEEAAATGPNADQPDPSVAGTFAVDAPCDAQTSADGRAICVPGGAFVLGSTSDQFGAAIAEPKPRRIAKTSRFFIDRNEVTVADLRAAIDHGLAAPPGTLVVNDAPLGVASPMSDLLSPFCTYTSTARDRETDPVTCIGWTLAHAYCVSKGGDLPTEAQWEYAAGTAGRARRTQFPWGDAEPTCDRAVFGRAQSGTALLGASGVCSMMGAPLYVQPVATDVDPIAGDVTPLGIANLGGSVREWMRDSFAAYSDPCWESTSLASRTCTEANARFRSVRGGSWADDGINDVGTRDYAPTGAGVTSTVVTGFRCAYETRP